MSRQREKDHHHHLCLPPQHHSLPLFSRERRRRYPLLFKMLVSLYHQTTLGLGSPFKGTQIKGRDPNPSCLSKSLFPNTGNRNGKGTTVRRPLIHASLIEAPVLWAGRVCIFYALLKTGLAGSDANPLVSELRSGTDDDFGFSEWLQSFQGRSEEKEASDRRKLVSKWHPTTKGTLKRSYRVASKPIGKRLLKAIASLLSDDDHFRDATSHKGCQIRRESAHGESVCCNNVRALFDELPTPHLFVEITPFPAGPLTEKDYAKAEKLEKVLRSGASI